eukprot:scaffold196776_cov32-Tisochrysis_lutea.AAC.1
MGGLRRSVWETGGRCLVRGPGVAARHNKNDFMSMAQFGWVVPSFECRASRPYWFRAHNMQSSPIGY